MAAGVIGSGSQCGSGDHCEHRASDTKLGRLCLAIEDMTSAAECRDAQVARWTGSTPGANAASVCCAMIATTDFGCSHSSGVPALELAGTAAAIGGTLEPGRGQTPPC
jgi:hypothetical protein